MLAAPLSAKAAAAAVCVRVSIIVFGGRRKTTSVSPKFRCSALEKVGNDKSDGRVAFRHFEVVRTRKQIYFEAAGTFSDNSAIECKLFFGSPLSSECFVDDPPYLVVLGRSVLMNEFCECLM